MLKRLRGKEAKRKAENDENVHRPTKLQCEREMRTGRHDGGGGRRDAEMLGAGCVVRGGEEGSDILGLIICRGRGEGGGAEGGETDVELDTLQCFKHDQCKEVHLWYRKLKTCIA